MTTRAFSKPAIALLLPTVAFCGSLSVGRASFFDLEDSEDQTPKALQFAERTDEQAPLDLRELRWMLSQLETEKGKKDPLADYVEKPSSIEERPERTAWKEDDEAHTRPKLFKNSNAEYSSPNLQPSLSVPKLSRGASSGNGPTQRARIESVNDSCYVPLVNRSSTSTKLVSSSSTRSSLQPEIPFGSQPTTLPGMGSTPVMPPMSSAPSGGLTPVLPNAGIASPPPGISGQPGFTGQPGVFGQPGLVGQPGLGDGASAAPIYNPPPTGALPYASPSTGVPAMIPGSPPSSNPSLINPSPSGYTSVPLSGVGGTGVGAVMTAPPATYIPPSGLGSTAQPSTYDPRTGIVNSQPFVNAPPCQTDARFMVSPTVYRQSTSCNNSGSQPYEYAPNTGTPFSYTPPTYFPGAFNGYASQYRPLIGFGQDVRQAQLGRGIVGQPVAYMPSQPLRNILRYLFP